MLKMDFFLRCALMVACAVIAGLANEWHGYNIAMGIWVGAMWPFVFSEYYSTDR